MGTTDSGILHKIKYNVTFKTSRRWVPLIMLGRNRHVPQEHLIELEEAARERSDEWPCRGIAQAAVGGNRSGTKRYDRFRYA